LVNGAEVIADDPAIGVTRQVVTDDSGRYRIAALPIGDYRLEVHAHGFRTQIRERIRIEVARTATQDFQLQVGDVSQDVTVTTTRTDLIERATISVGNVIDRERVQTLPLNGRYFNHGITEPIGLPQISVAGGLNFGGPSINPSGRGDTTFIVADSFSYERAESFDLGPG
jgi:hypothetical protein